MTILESPRHCNHLLLRKRLGEQTDKGNLAFYGPLVFAFVLVVFRFVGWFVVVLRRVFCHINSSN